jgi:hypothetical protein
MSLLRRSSHHPVESPVRRRKLLAFAIGIALGAVLAHGRAVANPFLLYDAGEVIFEDPVVNGPLAGALTGAFLNTPSGPYWQPLTVISFAMDHALFNLDSRAVHGENVVLHATCALLVFALLLEFMPLGGAFGAALLFAVHPINVESVAWAVERRTVLSAAFGLGSALCYVRWARNGRRWRYWLAVALFAASMMSKPLLAAFPVMLLGLDLLLDRWSIRDKLPFVVVSGAVSVVVIVTNAREQTGAPLLVRLQNAAVLPFRHLAHIAWPMDLVPYYPFPASVPWWPLGLLGIVLVSAAAWRWRPALAAWIWFLAGLLPTAGILQSGDWAALANRHVYVSAIAVFAIVGWVSTRIRYGILVPVAASVLLVPMTMRLTGIWGDGVALWSYAAERVPSSAVVWGNLGDTLAVEKRYAEAIQPLNIALSLDPSRGVAHTNLAICLGSVGNREAAIPHALAAIAACPTCGKPREVLAWLLAQ